MTFVRKNTLSRWFSSLQQRLHIDVPYFISNSLWLSLNQLVNSASLAVSGVFLANLLPKESYGHYTYGLTLFSLAGIAALPGLYQAEIQSVASSFEGNLLILQKTQAKWGLIGSILALIASLYYFKSDPVIASLLILIAVFNPIFQPSSLYLAFLSGRKKFAVLSAFLSSSQVIVTVATILSAVVSKNPITIFFTYCLSTIISNIIFQRYCLSRFKRNSRIDPAVKTYGKHLTFMSALSTISAYLDRILTFNLLGPAALATYAIAISPLDMMKGFMSIGDALSLPKLTEQSKGVIRNQMTSHILKLSLIGISVVTVYILAAPTFFHLLFPKYSSSIFLSQIFALSLLNFALFPAGTYLQAKKLIREQYLVNIFSSVFQITSMVIFITTWGLLGLVVARVLTRFSTSLLILFLYFREPIDTIQE